MDIDNHTAKDLAAINNRDEILRYLDAATAHLENNDKLVIFKTMKPIPDLTKINFIFN